LELRLAGAAPINLSFDLEVQAHLRMAELAIRDGAIESVGAVDGAIAASLSYRGAPLHEPLKARQLAVVAKWVLDPPVRIH
jgi:hypothetical protein